MNAFTLMALAFLVLVVACLVGSWIAEPERPLVADTLFWAATVLSVFCVAAGLMALVVRVLP